MGNTGLRDGFFYAKAKATPDCRGGRSRVLELVDGVPQWRAVDARDGARSLGATEKVGGCRLVRQRALLPSPAYCCTMVGTGERRWSYLHEQQETLEVTGC
jgi:hypothetical protein